MPGNFLPFPGIIILFLSEKQVERTYFTNQAAASSFPSLLFSFSYIIIIATTIDVINTADTAAITHSQKNPTCIFLIS